MAQQVMRDARKAIDVLGGVVTVAKLCGVGRNAVSNWYRRGFPPEAYAVLAPRLRKRGYVFSEKLFRQYRPNNRGNPPPTRRTGR